MNITVTGATGTIGRVLVERLLRDGHTVTVLSRKPKRANLPKACQVLAWNPDSELPPAEALQNAGAIVHLAGAPIAARRWTPKIKAEIRNSRVIGTRKLLRALRDCGARPEVVVSASAIGIYGNRGDEALTERSAPGDGFLAEVCKDWESELLGPEIRDLQARKVALRIGVVLSPRGGFLSKLEPLFSRGLGGRLGSGRQWMSWIHVEDLVELMVRSLTDPSLQGPINAVSPEPTSNAAFTVAIAQALNRPAPWIVPSFALKLMMGEMSCLALESQRVLPEKAMKSGFAFRWGNLGAALRNCLG